MAEPTQPLLRYATRRDAPAIAHCHVRCWQTAYRGLIPDELIDSMTVETTTERWVDHLSAEAATSDHTTVVAALDGRIVGTISVGSASTDAADPVPHSPGMAEVLVLYVDPDHQGSGVGSLLLETGERILRNRSFDRAVLWTLDGNEPAIEFYRSHGWQLDGEQRRAPSIVPGVEVDEVRMTVDLTRAATLLTDNRTYWDGEAADYAAQGLRSWSAEPAWGIFGIPDAHVGLMPDVVGLDVIELGCGTGYVSAWCLRAGARRAIGIDNSSGQLRTARSLAKQHELPLHLVWGDAQDTPFADRSFDLAINEYGAAIWCDPHRWIPEAARLLRPDGLLVFLGNSVISMLAVNDFEAVPATATLQRPQRNIHQLRWPDTDASEFHISHGSMIRLLRSSGFEVLDLIELYADPDAETSFGFIDAEWASKWPVEEAWIARRIG